MTHNIEKPDKKTYAIALNSINNVVHVLEVGTNNVLTTGQPLLASDEDKETCYNLVFSSYDIEDGELIDYTLRPIQWAVGYSLADAKEVIAVFHQLLSNIRVDAVKHPDREEYALPWSDFIVNTAPNGALKTAILDAHESSVDAGNVRTNEEMISQGWS